MNWRIDFSGAGCLGWLDQAVPAAINVAAQAGDVRALTRVIVDRLDTGAGVSGGGAGQEGLTGHDRKTLSLSVIPAANVVPVAPAMAAAERARWPPQRRLGRAASGTRWRQASGVGYKGLQVTRQTETSSAFCPSSNLFLGSGLFGWQQAAAAGVNVSLASDVGGGASLSMLRTMADGYKVQALAGRRLTAWALLHAATRGAAQALRLGDEIGSLQPGAMADLCLWDYAVGAVAQRRDALARNALTRDAMGRHLHERLIAWVTLADDRNLAETWIGGVCRFSRCGGSSASALVPAPQP